MKNSKKLKYNLLVINNHSEIRRLPIRKIYEELFPARGNVHSRWIPKTQWDGVSYDPSGRAQSVHNSKLQII